MTSHIPHNDVLTHGLHPGCPRCIEHTRAPLSSLDRAMLDRLSAGVLYTELDRIAADNLRVQMFDLEVRRA